MKQPLLLSPALPWLLLPCEFSLSSVSLSESDGLVASDFLLKLTEAPILLLCSSPLPLSLSLAKAKAGNVNNEIAMSEPINNAVNSLMFV